MTSHTVFRLPRSHWHCEFDHFQWDAVRPPSLQTDILQFLENARIGSPHLILIGQPGVGKTHLGVSAYRWMVPHVGTMLATWLNVPAFCDQVKASYNEEGFDPFDDYMEATRFVVLDDLFGRKLTPHESEQIVTRLLDTAYQNGAAMIITMNQTLEEAAAKLHRHEISRLLSQGTIIEITGTKDWRQV